MKTLSLSVLCPALLLAAVTVPPVAAEEAVRSSAAGQPEVRTELLDEKGFAGFLDALRRGRPAPWPQVVSAGYRSPLAPEESGRQRESRRLARVLLQGIEEYQAELSGLPLGAFVPTAETLLDLRDAVAAGEGYVNLLLADALNRVLYVELAKRLVGMGSAPPGLAAAVDRLRTYEFEPKHLVTLAEGERGEVMPDAEEVERESGARAVFYHLLEEVGGDLGHLGGLRPTEELAASTVYSLLDTPSLARLLTRYWQTDYSIHIRLPLLARYLGESEDLGGEYDYERVRAALNLSSEQVRQSYDSIINRTRRTAVSDVLGLAETVQSGRIDAFMAFGGDAEESQGPERGAQETQAGE